MIVIGDRRLRTTRSADGTEIGFVTIGSAPPLVLVLLDPALVASEVRAFLASADT